MCARIGIVLLLPLLLGLASCQVSGGTAWLPLEDEHPAVHRLRYGQEVPPILWPLGEQALRLADGEHWSLWDGQGQWHGPLQAGAYTLDDQFLVYLRDAEGVAGHARSMQGMPVQAASDGHQRARQALGGQSYDPISLLIHSWRLADDFPWPWVNHLGPFGGLAAYLQRLHPPSGLHFDPEQGYYIDAQGDPVRIVDPQEPVDGDPGLQLYLGDVLASGVGQEVGTITILVEDRGIPGFLDPEDVVVSAQEPGGAAAWQIRQDLLGHSLGEVPVHAFRRHRIRAEEHLTQRHRGDNPVWRMEGRQVWMLIAGMIILILTLLRWGRRQRKMR